MLRIQTFCIASRNVPQANEVYAQKEKPIPVVPCSDAFISDMRHYELQKQLRYKQNPSQISNSSYRFSRDELKEALVVDQVDSKFIACLLPSGSMTGDAGYGSEACSQGPSRTLVLVDQHAADERVRVEWLQREICLAYLRNDDGTGVKRIVLDPPVPILLTRHEKLVLQRSDDLRDLLASWGVEFSPIKDVREEDSPTDDDDSSYSQVTVAKIPEIVGNRVCDILALAHLNVDGRTSYLRGMTCRISSGVCSETGPMTHPEDHASNVSGHTTKTPSRGREHYASAPPNSWSCSTPRLAEVSSPNSFARPKFGCSFLGSPGAIMFNDSLTLDQCKGLMEQLTHTSVPFRCAHGRPSIVPLVELGPAADLRGATRYVNWEAYGDHIQAQARTTRHR